MDLLSKYRNVCFWLDGSETRAECLGQLDSDILPFYLQPDHFWQQLQASREKLAQIPVPSIYRQIRQLQEHIPHSSVIDMDISGWAQRAACQNVLELHGSASSEITDPAGRHPGFVFSGEPLDPQLCQKANEELMRSQLVVANLSEETASNWSHWLGALRARGVCVARVNNIADPNFDLTLAIARATEAPQAIPSN